MSESFAPDLICWRCHGPASIRCAMKESPERYLFDLCESCLPELGEALVRWEAKP